MYSLRLRAVTSSPSGDSTRQTLAWQFVSNFPVLGCLRGPQTPR
nr:MAG TPA: hypothetical protein [Bacteriophage sp.]